MWGFLFLIDRSSQPIPSNLPIFLIFPELFQGKVARQKPLFLEKQGVHHVSLGMLDFVEKNCRLDLVCAGFADQVGFDGGNR
jgi:hypothetical protein